MRCGCERQSCEGTAPPTVAANVMHAMVLKKLGVPTPTWGSRARGDNILIEKDHHESINGDKI